MSRSATLIDSCNKYYCTAAKMFNANSIQNYLVKEKKKLVSVELCMVCSTRTVVVEWSQSVSRTLEYPSNPTIFLELEMLIDEF